MPVVSRLLVALVLFVFVNPVFALDIVEREFENSDAVIAALRKGGLIIYLRHAATDHEQADKTNLDFNDCSTQRNLSAMGREQARDIGRAFKALGIAVTQVFSSPYCRCTETAELAFGDYKVIDQLGFSISATSHQTTRMSETLSRMLMSAPTHGNTVIVSHTANLKEAAGIWPKPEGVALMFRPIGNDVIEYYGKLEPKDWAGLLQKI